MQIGLSVVCAVIFWLQHTLWENDMLNKTHEPNTQSQRMSECLLQEAGLHAGNTDICLRYEARKRAKAVLFEVVKVQALTYV